MVAKNKLPEKNTQTKTVWGAYINALHQYFSFQGRAGKFDYWGFLLVNNVISLIISLFVIFSPISVSAFLSVILSIYTILMFMPTITILIRRLHDTNHSAKIVWIYFILFISTIAFSAIQTASNDELFSMILSIISYLVLLCCSIYITVLIIIRGNPTSNKYGEPIFDDEKHNKLANIMIVVYMILVAFWTYLNYRNTDFNVLDAQTIVSAETTLEQQANGVLDEKSRNSKNDLNLAPLVPLH